MVPEWNEGLSPRAEEELQKKYKAFLAVRRPQDDLDPRIIDFNSNPWVQQDLRPCLLYGFSICRKNLNVCIARNNVRIYDHNDPKEASDQDVCWFLQAFLSNKFMLSVSIKRPFSDKEGEYVALLDDTLRMRQTNKKSAKLWATWAPRTLRQLREEFGLPADQKPMWYWAFDYGPNFECPILEYNPPQVSRAIRKRLGELDSEEEDEDNSDLDTSTDEEEEEE